MTTYVIVIAAACVALVGWAFARSDLARQVLGAVLAVAMVFAVVATLFEDPVAGIQHDLLAMFALVLAVAGGGVVTNAVFETIDAARDDTADFGGGEVPHPVAHGRTVMAAAELLRGGAWVGALERLAVFGTLAARWPEGIAIVLAVKGLGRYPELKSAGHSGAAERFIVGTMVSVIWAGACAFLAFAPYVVARHG